MSSPTLHAITDVTDNTLNIMKRVITTKNAPAAIGPYNQAIEANGTLYISGQIPINPETGTIVEGGIKEQTEQALKNIGEILKAAGHNYNNVVKTTCLLSDIDDFASFNEVYAKYFDADNAPARACFAVKAIPRNAKVEIEAISVI